MFGLVKSFFQLYYAYNVMTSTCDLNGLYMGDLMDVVRALSSRLASKAGYVDVYGEHRM
jgi:hypothetical protein